MRFLFKPVLLSCVLLSPGVSYADDAPQNTPVTLTLLSSSGVMGAVQAIAPEYEKTTGVKLAVKAAPPRGPSPQAIPNRLDRNEQADVVLTVGVVLDKLIAQGQVDKSTRVDLGKSFIAMAVLEGAVKPDIGSMKAFRQTLISADSVAYSGSSGGAYLSHWLFPHMALDQNFKLKSKAVPDEPVGNVVARGEAQLGVQQLSELISIPGIDIVGLIPDKAQQMILYSGGVLKNSSHPAEAMALLDYMESDKGREALEQSGLKPIH
ncbi:substrate-binding domain-containing protein [Pseudomonas sp. G.S.17]|uniref:substrate-binding domain-containing protein n=1 Tax=Pseudomonas sp. G.S.17 TaxID=3137451 RepID=UPI00311CACA3